jgi:hypothetical protein
LVTAIRKRRRGLCQEGWPFENRIFGSPSGEGLLGEECQRHGIAGTHEEDPPVLDSLPLEDGLLANDLFIVEGPQERYGSKRVWEVGRG